MLMDPTYRKISEEFENYKTGRWLTDFSNFSAIVFKNLNDINWAGFYLDDGEKLILGPFCGKPACTEIAYHRGVCGDSFSKKQSILVPDVHEYPGHIACDSASRSELVIPLVIDDKVIGVFDMDSPQLNRFSPHDQSEMSQILTKLLNQFKSNRSRFITLVQAAAKS